jgi:hypothetical protein
VGLVVGVVVGGGVDGTDFGGVVELRATVVDVVLVATVVVVGGMMVVVEPDPSG